MASGDQLIFAGFAIAGGAFVTVLFLHIRLKHYVAKEKVHAVEDVLQLWPPGVGPSKIALNAKGLRLRRYSEVSIVILLIAVGMIGLSAILEISSRPDALFAIVAGSFLAGTFFESRVKHHVSNENIRAVEDVSNLWKFSWPPMIVLNEKGPRSSHSTDPKNDLVTCRDRPDAVVECGRSDGPLCNIDAVFAPYNR